MIINYEKSISHDLRRELVYRSNGELPFTSIYGHYQTRRVLAQKYDCHYGGTGGEFLRNFVFSQELFGIGRKKRANIENIIKYRMNPDGLPNSILFNDDWFHMLYSSFYSRIEEICNLKSNTETTQQSQAWYIWRMTGHVALWTSSTFGWLPTVPPEMCAGFLKAAISIPWYMKLTTNLQRNVMKKLSPQIADHVNGYGGTCGTINLSNIHLFAYQGLKELNYLFKKIEGVVFKGAISNFVKRKKTKKIKKNIKKAFLTDEFPEFVY